MKPDFSKIKLLVCNFDGVMTDDRVLADQYRKEAVFCSRSDGLGIELLKKGRSCDHNFKRTKSCGSS